MTAIHNHAELTPTCDLGSQNYEQWVVQKERQGENRFLRSSFASYRLFSLPWCVASKSTCLDPF